MGNHAFANVQEVTGLTGTSQSLTSLTSNVTYYYSVQSFNSTYNSPPSNVISFTATATAPTTQASSINFSSIATTSMTIGWTRGNGSKLAVFIKDGSGAITNPSNNTTYTANTTFGSGTQLGSSGYYCVYNGTGTSVSISGLTMGNTYYVQAFEYNGSAGAEIYYTSTATNNPNSQLAFAAASVTTVAASSIGTTSATLNATISANGDLTTNSFEYGTTISPYPSSTSGSPTTTSTQNTSVTASVSSLLTNTLYHFRAKGVNTAGTTNGSDATFTTLSNAPTVGAGSGAISTSFIANWTAPTNDGSETYTYTIEVDDDNAFGSVDATYSGIASGTLSQVVTGLASATTYYFRVKAVNAGGSSAWSSTSVGYATLSAVAPTVATGTVTSSSIVVDGAQIASNNISSDGGSTITARGLVYNTTTPAETGGTLAALGSGTTGSYSQTLSSLSANTLYYAKAYATNGIGTSYGSEVSFTTLATEPTNQSTVTFGTKTTTSLVINFSSGNGGRRFLVARALNNSFSFVPSDRIALTGTIDANFSTASDQGSGDKIVYDGIGTTVTVTGLSANTVYYFSVYEYNNNSAGVPNYFTTAGTANTTTYNPTITVGSVTAFSNQVVSTTSTAKSYAITGSELVSDITVTSPSTSFLISSDNISYSSSPITFAKDGSDAVSATIYVKYSPVAADGATGSLNITNAATSATTKNVAVSGNAIATVPTTEGSISFGTVTGTSIIVNLPTVGNGSNRIIVVKAGSSPTAPTDGVAYTANSVFASGSNTGSSSYIVYNGNAPAGSSIVTVTGLAGSTTYYFAVYEYNVGTGTSQNYIGTSTVTASQTTGVASNATDAFRTATTGNWNATTTWESNTGGTWVPSTLAPNENASAITIKNGHTVSITSSVTADDITIDAGGQINLTPGNTFTLNDGAASTDLTINGTFIKQGGTFTQGTSTITVSATGVYEDAHNSTTITIPTATWTTGSLCRISGIVGTASTDYNNLYGVQQAFSNFEVNCTNLVGKLVLTNRGSNATPMSISGNLTVVSTGASAGTNAGYSLSLLKSGTQDVLSIGGNLIVTGGSVYGISNTSTAETRTITVGGNITLSNSGVFDIINTTGGTSTCNLTLKVAGNISVATGATFTRTSSSGTSVATLNFNGTGTQTVTNSGTFGGFTGITNITTTNGTGTVLLNTDLTTSYGLTVDGSNFTISNGKTYTMSAASTATVSIASGKTLTVDGTIVNSSTASTPFTTTGTLSVNGKYQHNISSQTLPIATWNTGSTIEVTGLTSVTTPVNFNQSFYHFIWNCPNQTAGAALGGNLTTINGDFTITDCGSVAGTIRDVRLFGNSGTGTLTVGGNLIINSNGQLAIINSGSNGSGAGVLTVNGNTTIAGKLDMTGTSAFTATSSTLNLKGDLLISSSGTLVRTQTTSSTVNFVKLTGTQSLTSTAGGMSLNTINYNVGDASTLNTLQLLSNITLGTSSNFTVYNQATLDLGTNIIDGSSGTFTLNSGAGIITANTAGITTTGATGSVQVTGTRTYNTGTNYTYNAIAAQTTGSGLPATVNNLTINNSAGLTLTNSVAIAGALGFTSGSLSLNNKTLTLNGSITGTSSLVGSAGSSLSIGGTGALGTLNFDQTTDGTTNTLASLTLNRTSSGSATLGNKLVLIDALTPTAGTLNTGGYLHLRSRSTNTARIAAGATGGGYINGDVTVERYMSSANSGVSNRAYRLITPSVTTTNYIRDNWQEGTNNSDVSTNNNPTSHYGTHITGLAGNSAGFDVTQNNSNSLYNYNQTTNVWDAVTNTNATILDAKKGYLIFIRGSRNSIATINTTTGYTDSVILRAKGSIAQGDQTFTLTGGVSGDFALVTNPYPAPINWASVYTTNSSNFNSSVTIWDPNQGSRGGYVTVTSGGVTTPGTSALTTNIQTGQAFFVQLNASAPTLNINEAHKSTTNNLNVYRTTTNAERLNINLKYTASGAERNADGVTALIDNSYNNAVDGDDAEQIQNWDEDVALLRGNKELSIESRSNANTTDTLFLQTLRLRAAQANYKWEVEPLNIATITEASLIDNFTNTVTPLSLTNKTIINFTVSSNTASLTSNRFKIVFKTNAALPVTVTKFTAQLKNNGVQLTWNTANEQNINNYEIERSVDGRVFTSITSVKASNSSSYNTIDNNPHYGNNYYRLKINEQTGKVNYSNIIKIQVGKQASTLVTIYPNPIINNIANVQFINATKGNYTISLYNNIGQKVYEKTLEHLGGSSTEALALGNLLPHSQYQLQIRGSNGYQNIETIVK